MIFDENWEKNIYLKGKQINRFPFDWVVSITNRNFIQVENLLDMKVLELGCGTGNNLKFFLQFGFGRVYGIDGSPTAINLAQNFNSGFEDRLILKTDDFASISIEDASLDFILDRGSITHNSFSSCRKILSEVLRILKPGGIFASMMFSNSHSALEKGSQISHSFYKAFRSETPNNEGLNTCFLSKDDVLELLKQMKIISLIHKTNEELVGEKSSSAVWNIVARK